VHNGKTKDLSIRPNQLWALAIAEPLLSKSDGEKLLKVVEDELLTPRGLRTLSPRDPKYIGHYWGNQTQRDQAYHQGTVWPWLLGIYIDAVIAVRGKKHLENIIPMLAEIRTHFYEEACVGHISEIFDGDSPWLARGAPAQAWSLSEILRIESIISQLQEKKIRTDKKLSSGAVLND
jgi:glycogen debranching enzyme